MKVLVLLSLVALCYSTPIVFQKHITVGGDDTITVVGTEGREIDIYKSVIDPRKINIILKSKYGPTRKIQVDETDNIENVDLNIVDSALLHSIPREQVTQGDILAHIFRKYQGVVDESTYKTLLERIHGLVKNGLVNQYVWNVLNDFNGLKVEQVDAKQVLDNIVQEKDVVLPTEEVNQVRRVSEVVPVEGAWKQNQYSAYYPRSYGIQGLWNLENMTPYQRQMLLQHIRQGVEGKLGQSYKNQVGQYQWSPLNRFLYNAGVYRTQQYDVPQYYRGQQYEVPQYYMGQQYQVPQYYRGQYVPQYYSGEQYEIPEYYRGQQYHGEEYQGQQYQGQQYRGQQMKELEQLVGLEQNREYYHQVPQDIVHQQYYSRYVPQQAVYQQYGYGRVPLVY